MRFLIFTAIAIAFFPFAASAAAEDVQIAEIMYDPAGADAPDNGDRHEWVELWNGGSDTVTIVSGSCSSSWCFNDGNASSPNHKFSTIARGSLTLAPGDFLIISSNTDTFLADHPSFSGNLVKVSFTLGNTADTLSLRIGTTGATWSEVSYSKNQGANGNGKTLEWNRETGAWSGEGGRHTPGSTLTD
jgi:hypothetical protein